MTDEPYLTGREQSDDCFWGPPEAKRERMNITHLLKGTYIYFLFKGKRLQYIGKTTCVLSRIGSHRKRIPFDRVEILKIAPHRLGWVESLLIKSMDPAYNIKSHPNERQRSRGRVNHGNVTLGKTVTVLSEGPESEL